MTRYTTSNTESDLNGILDLQKANLKDCLSTEEKQSQGFLSLAHSYEELQKLNNIEKHIIAIDRERVVGYVLSMTKASGGEIPLLIPMFEQFHRISFKGKSISEYNYVVVGQVCIDKSYRGQGVFADCYAEYRNRLRDKYDFAITEIATANLRSMAAHKKVGFQELERYIAPDRVEWSIVLWDWKKI